MAQAVNVYSEFSEKVDDFGSTIRKSEEKDKRRQNDRKQFLSECRDPHSKELSEFCVQLETNSIN